MHDICNRALLNRFSGSFLFQCKSSSMLSMYNSRSIFRAKVFQNIELPDQEKE